MTEQIVSFETAKLARQKGFDVRCEQWYTDRWNTEPVYGLKEANGYYEKGYTAPTQSLIQKWLREVHVIYISPMFIGPDTNKFKYRLDILGSGMTGTYSEWFDYWEDCLESGLQKALSLIPNK